MIARNTQNFQNGWQFYNRNELSSQY
jgi:hypothetical protein